MKRIIKLIIALAAGVLSAANLKAQSTEPFSPYSTLSPSVESWQMTRYGNLRPSLYTGAMTYSIPVFTYTDSDFNIPISLSYSYDGFRPAQDSGTIGYGWYLDCGGVITREVRGLPDEDIVRGGADRPNYGYYFSTRHSNGYKGDSLFSLLSNECSLNDERSIYSNGFITGAIRREDAVRINPYSSVPIQIATRFKTHSSQQDSMQTTTIMNISDNDTTYVTVTRPVTVTSTWTDLVPDALGACNYDLTPDIYHFSFLGHSGDFMLQPDGSVRVFNSDLPHGELSVEFDSPVMSCHDNSKVAISGFSITDGNGYRYLFGMCLTAMEFAASKSTTSRDISQASVVTTAWRLHGIEAPDGRYVEFHYSTGHQVSKRSSIYHSPLSTGTAANNPSLTGYSITYIFSSLLEGISVDGVRIASLSYDLRAQDENESTYFHPNSIYMNVAYDHFSESPSKRLKEVLITNGDNQTVERVILEQEHARTGTPKMFLRAVSSLQKGTHQFCYNTSGINFPLNNTGSTDHWGYWNGKTYRDIREITTSHGSRYLQMSASNKEPDLNYAAAAALTHITYPTGGSTYIEYEGIEVRRGLGEEGSIHEPADEINVGGVRVKAVTDRNAPEDPGRITQFAYSDGFLFHMPRYKMAIPIDYRYIESYLYEQEGIMKSSQRWDAINTTVTAYDADCDYNVSRDCNVGYGEVRVTHPDGSSTINRFSNYEGDFADGFMPDNLYETFGKRGNFELFDNIDGPEGTYASYIAYPCSDRKNMRGRPLSVCDYDAEGTLLQRKDYSYTYDTVSLNWIYFNNLDTFIRMPWECRSAILSEERTTDYRYGTALTTSRSLDYNSLGQIACETISSPQDPDRTVSTSYSYLHQDGGHEGSTLPAAISHAQRIASLLGSTYSLMKKDFSYENSALHTRPCTTNSYSPFMNSGIRSTLFLRDNRFRETQVTLPGNNHIWYVWSGNNLGSAASGTAANRKGYSWKDLVGLTGMTLPDGRTQTCTYSERNRPWERRDSDNNIMSSNQIQLRYE